MKSFLYLAALLLLVAPFGVSAQETATTTKPARPFEERRHEIKGQASSSPIRAAIGEIRKEIKGKGQGETLENAKERAQLEIERREAILTAQIARLEGAKKITDADKTTLIANLEARLAELTALRSDIQNSIGTTTLRADIESLKTLHKEFRAELPKAALTGGAERILAVASQMEQLSSKLEARITAKEGEGTDVASLRALLTTLNTTIAQAKTYGQTALEAAKTVDESTAAQVKATIVSGQEKIKEAREIAKEIIQGLGGKVPANQAQ